MTRRKSAEQVQVAPKPVMGMFRAQALEEVNVAAQVDNMLPLTSMRTWLAIVGVSLVIVAALLYALGAEQVVSVRSVGRVVSPPGIGIVASPAAGTVAEVLRGSGDSVTAGQAVATGLSPDGRPWTATAPISGTIWQVLRVAGQVVTTGAEMASIMPQGSGTDILTPVPEADARAIDTGMVVNITTPTDGRVQGTVAFVPSSPVPGQVAEAWLALPLVADEPMIIVVVHAAESLPRGEQMSVQIVIAEESLMTRLVRQS